MHQSMHDVRRSADRVKLNRTSTTTFFVTMKRIAVTHTDTDTDTQVY